MYSKQINLKGGYSWNKMWSLKSLVMLRFESGTSLHAINISHSQGLFWCSVLNILEMASVDTLFLCPAGQQAWLCS